MPSDLAGRPIDEWPVNEERSEDGLQCLVRYLGAGNPVVRVRMLTFERWQGFPPFEVSVLDYRTVSGQGGDVSLISEEPLLTANDWPTALAKGRAALRQAWEEKVVKNAELRLGAQPQGDWTFKS